MNPVTRFLLRFAAPIFWVSLGLTVVGTFFSVQLYKNLRTDLEELLPTTARSVIDLGEVTQRLQAIDNLSVVVISENSGASKRFVTDLAEKLKPFPKNTIASVEYKITDELAFFKKRRALYMELADLERIRKYIKDRINYEYLLYNPLTIFSGVDTPEPRLDLSGLQQKYEGKTSAFSRFPDGYYATPDGKKRVVLIYKPGKTSGVASVFQLKKIVEGVVADLNPKSYSPDLTILYTGGVQNTIEEQSALVADLELSTIVTMLLCAIGIYVFFRAGRATVALMIALLMGTFWTFGASYFAVGYLNANSAFLGAIVLGNGINFPIILLARYLEERRNDLTHEAALNQALTHTATATWTAALAAGLAYGSLSLTSFRGFKQFGIIGLIGMVLCWIAAFVVLPVILTMMERRRSLRPKKAAPPSYFAGSIALLVSRYPKPITFVSLALCAVSALMLFRYDKSILETNLAKLRNKTSMERGSGYLSQHVDEIFQRYLTPMVILPKSREDALRIAQELRNLKERQGADSLIASVSTIDDFIPKDQPEKIRVIRDIEKLLSPEIVRRLSEKERGLARDFLAPEAKQPLTLQDLPPLVINKFTEKDGSIGKLVLVEPPLGTVTLNGDNLVRFIQELRSVADSVAPGTPLAGALPISADMIVSISKDGPKATLFAFLAVVILVIVLFRKVHVFSPVLLALGIGILWMAGIILGYWFKINFLNFIALPITFGIGVDYGVNIFSRFREEGSASILKVLKDTGGAVALCSFTTMVGYGSLLIAENQAFVSFGLLAVLGEITCLVAAMISLPAFLLWMDQRKKVGNDNRAFDFHPEGKHP